VSVVPRCPRWSDGRVVIEEFLDRKCKEVEARLARHGK
jgi:hypothetical protein